MPICNALQLLDFCNAGRTSGRRPQDGCAGTAGNLRIHATSRADAIPVVGSCVDWDALQAHVERLRET